MIRFCLVCEKNHGFDAWFRNGEDFEIQNEKRQVCCPQCSSRNVQKTLMVPAVSTSRKQTAMSLAMREEQKTTLTRLRALSHKIRQHADYVGDRFAEEAKKVHFGEKEPCGIYGEATLDEVRELIDTGVDFMPLPIFPEDRH